MKELSMDELGHVSGGSDDPMERPRCPRCSVFLQNDGSGYVCPDCNGRYDRNGNPVTVGKGAGLNASPAQEVKILSGGKKGAGGFLKGNHRTFLA